MSAVASPLGPVRDEDDLEERLSRPDAAVVESLLRVDGNLLVLGAGGKMGPTLARMAARAFREGGSSSVVTAVSRFGSPEVRHRLQQAGVEIHSADLLDADAVRELPDAPNVVFMAGMKFGATGAEALTWAMNAMVPLWTAQRFPSSRIVVFSSGNVYPLVPVGSGGADESVPPAPIGEYAQSVLARERLFEHGSRTAGTPMLQFRLNYANELRYGVLVDLAAKIVAGDPIDLTMGYVNVLWQRDASAWALRSLEHTASPPALLNVAGPETLSVRRLAEALGAHLGQEPRFVGSESPTALLNDASCAFALFGYPTVPVGRLVEWVSDWIGRSGSTLGRPTHFESRDGRF